MKRKVILMILILSSFVCLFAKGREFTDDAGRTREIPQNVNKIYSSSPLGTLIIYSLNERKLGGLNWTLSEEEKRFTSKYYQGLPVLGGKFGKRDNTNYEMILKEGCELVISIGDIDELTISNADRMEEKLGIPVLLLSLSLEKTAETYKKLGEIFNEEEKATVLAEYVQDLLDRTKMVTKRIPDEKKIRLYYADGVDGLQTDPAGSLSSEVISYVGAINVAKADELKGYGRATVNIEQVIKWNPEVVLICGDKGCGPGMDFYSEIFKSSPWQKIDALKNKKVYRVPNTPYNFVNRPPSINRFLGIIWLSNLLYPEYFDFDVKTEVKKFYKLFYHRELTYNEIDEILAESIVK